MADNNNESIQTVIDAINAIVGTSLEGYTEDVVNRLVSFGYVPTSSDAFAVAFAMTKAQNHILNQINDSTLPGGLREVYIDMVCGEFLKAKHQSGQLEIGGLDFSGAVQSVHEGDTTVTFDASGSDEAKFGGLVNWLIAGKEGDLICYRRIKW